MTRFSIVLAACAAWFTMGGPARAEEPAPNTLTEQEEAEGWKLLFDGKTTDGWRGFKKDKVPGGWKVVEGTLAFSKGGGDLVTVEKFANFELLIDWKISPKGNSGIMYRVSEDVGAPWQTGPEYQLLDNAGHGDGRNPKTSASSCYALIAPAKDLCKPVGQWNTTKIVCKGNQVEHWLNGEKVVAYELGSEEWTKLVKASKFKSLAKFGKNAQGHIDLQDHGNPVWFRNIKIKVLEEKK